MDDRVTEKTYYSCDVEKSFSSRTTGGVCSQE